MLRLKASKTSLYKLVAEYVALPQMIKTEFIKAYRSRSYWLKWHIEGTNSFFEAYFSTCGGRVMLSVEEKDWDNHTIDRKVYTIGFLALRERDMIEEVAKRGA